MTGAKDAEEEQHVFLLYDHTSGTTPRNLCVFDTREMAKDARSTVAEEREIEVDEDGYYQDPVGGRSRLGISKVEYRGELGP